MIRSKIMKLSFCLMAPLLLCTSVYAETSNKISYVPRNLENTRIENTLKVGIHSTVPGIDPFSNIGISIARNYVNIRQEPNLESEVVGKLYRGSAANIVEPTEEWTKISSGSVVGYISNEFLAVGDSAKQIADQYAVKIATVNATTLRVREQMSTEAKTLMLLPRGSSYSILEQDEGWYKIQVDNAEGYVSSDYIDLTYEFDNAVSIQEENSGIADDSVTALSTSVVDNSITTSQVSSSVAKNIVSYAKQFLGNPYVWGGTSLTDGIDCSAFVQAVYKEFDYKLPRTSRQQVKIGKEVEENDLQVGDLVFYADDDYVNHVGIYIGNNKIIHASNPKDGIKISKYNYKSPYAIRRIL